MKEKGKLEGEMHPFGLDVGGGTVVEHVCPWCGIAYSTRRRRPGCCSEACSRAAAYDRRARRAIEKKKKGRKGKVK